MWGNEVEFSFLTGKTIVGIEGATKGNDSVVFTLSTGDKYQLIHNQNCCESVYLENICGEISDLLGTEIGLAERVSNSTDPPPAETEPESYTWTFYKLATRKGAVTLRWFGRSNGYYSERVDFEKIEPTN